MKKILLLAALTFGLSQLGSAQTLEVDVDTDLCIDQVKVHFTDASTSTYQIGCTGTYTFTTSSVPLDYITINGVDCYPNTTTDVTVNNGKKAKAVLSTNSSNTDAILGLIR